MKLFTIGYEGASADQLVETLKNLGIEVLADVRELPLSRKRGLSKTALSEKLRDAGIEYRHFKQLGDPKPGRDAAKSGDFQTFLNIFNKHMSKPETGEALSELFALANEKLTCMLCFERCAKNCHRAIIADKAVVSGFEVYNVVADRPNVYLKNDIQIPRYHPSESFAAAE